MNDSDRKYFGKAFLEIKQSLDDAVRRAGGDSEHMCTVEHLMETSVFDFMCNLATNNVRFTYVQPLVEKEKVFCEPARTW